MVGTTITIMTRVTTLPMKMKTLKSGPTFLPNRLLMLKQQLKLLQLQPQPHQPRQIVVQHQFQQERVDSISPITTEVTGNPNAPANPNALRVAAVIVRPYMNLRQKLA